MSIGQAENKKSAAIAGFSAREGNYSLFPLREETVKFMQTGRRKTWFLLGCVLVLLGLIVGATQLLRPALLSDHATRLPCPDADYVWQSPHEIVTFATTAVPSASVGKGGPSQARMYAVRTDLTTGIQSTLSEFNALFPAHTLVDISGWNPSPDGVWLAYRASSPDDWQNDPTNVSIWELNGTRSFPAVEAREYNGNSSLPFSQTWLPDSRRYLRLDREVAGKARLFSLDVPSSDGVAVSIPIGSQSLLGVTPDYLLITSDFDRSSPASTKAVTLTTQGIYPNTAPAHSVKITLPAGATVRELSLSPQADRLLWTFSFTRRPALGVLLTHIAPKLASQFGPHSVTTLQISRLDGSEMRELGSEDDPIKDKNPEPIHMARWLPDGKRISYRYRNAVYLLPVRP